MIQWVTYIETFFNNTKWNLYYFQKMTDHILLWQKPWALYPLPCICKQLYYFLLSLPFIYHNKRILSSEIFCLLSDSNIKNNINHLHATTAKYATLWKGNVEVAIIFVWRIVWNEFEIMYSFEKLSSILLWNYVYDLLWTNWGSFFIFILFPFNWPKRFYPYTYNI